MSEQVIRPLLNRKQAAAALTISVRKLWELSDRGIIPTVKIGAAVRYDPADIAEFIARAKEGGAK
jgi:hypothetical protein